MVRHSVRRFAAHLVSIIVGHYVDHFICLLEHVVYLVGLSQSLDRLPGQSKYRSIVRLAYFTRSINHLVAHKASHSFGPNIYQLVGVTFGHSVGHSIGNLVGHLVGVSFNHGQSLGWLIIRSVIRLIIRKATRSVSHLVSWLVIQSVTRLIGNSFD